MYLEKTENSRREDFSNGLNARMATVVTNRVNNNLAKEALWVA